MMARRLLLMRGLRGPPVAAMVALAVCVAVLLLLAGPAGAITWSGNLLTNPGAESGNLSGWTTDHPTFVVASQFLVETSGTVTPHSGQWFFNMAAGPATPYTTAVLYQDVNVSGYAANIDAGLEVSLGGTWLQIEDALSMPGKDTAELTLYFWNSGGGAIGSLTTGQVTSPNLTWVQQQLQGTIPIGTRSVRVELKGFRAEGTYLNAFFDDVSLQVGTDELPGPPAVPEPVTMAGLALGIGSLATYLRRRKAA